METLSRYLTEDHAHCDDLFAAAENAVAAADWTTVEAGFDRFRAATQRHFQCEEDILFPAFESATGMTAGPTMVMRSEHEQIRQALAAMAEAVADRNADAYLGYGETLLMLLRQHNLKEEQILYPMTDRAMAGETPTLLARMQALPA
jgi:iron-sulfur cluster repair protein YtfE (RIC family)